MAVFRSVICKSFLLILLPLVVNSKGDLKTLNEETWQEMLNGEWMIEFFAPWCPACRQLEPVWKEFAGWADDLAIQVGAVDVTTNPGLSGRFAITALPTIFHVKDGVFRQYRGSKRKEELISFVEDGKWNDVEPIPSWKSPQSFQMSSLAYFFKFSMFLRNVHNDLVELGVPHWGSYVIFGLATILLGAILGLLIVYIIDHVCPAKKPWHGIELRKEPEAEIKPDEKPRITEIRSGGGIASIPEDEEKDVCGIPGEEKGDFSVAEADGTPVHEDEPDEDDEGSTAHVADDSTAQNANDSSLKVIDRTPVQADDGDTSAHNNDSPDADSAKEAEHCEEVNVRKRVKSNTVEKEE